MCGTRVPLRQTRTTHPRHPHSLSRNDDVIKKTTPLHAQLAAPPSHPPTHSVCAAQSSIQAMRSCSCGSLPCQVGASCLQCTVPLVGSCLSGADAYGKLMGTVRLTATLHSFRSPLFSPYKNSPLFISVHRGGHHTSKAKGVYLYLYLLACAPLPPVSLPYTCAHPFFNPPPRGARFWCAVCWR